MPLRRPAIALAAALFAVPSLAHALAGRFGDPVAVRGAPVQVRVELLDDPGIVDRVVIELSAGSGPWRSREAEREGAWWTARFPAEIWSAPAEPLRARATAYGRRGGIVLQLGADDPLELEILEPERAAERRRDLSRTSALLEAEDDEVILAALVGVESRLADRARLRAVIGAEVPFSRGLSLAARVTVGPAFSPPANLDGGAVGLGLETGLRWRSGPPLPGVIATYAGPRAGIELRLPGVDALLGAEAGLQWSFSRQGAFELGLVGGASLLHLADDPAPVDVGFAGGLRAGVRLGGAES